MAARQVIASQVADGGRQTEYRRIAMDIGLIS